VVAFGGRVVDPAVDREGNAMTKKAVPTVFIDNERVRVTEWRFAPGAATGWHRHEMDYVVVPMADGALELEGLGGERSRAELKQGAPYFRSAGVEHDVINANAFEFAFVEIELKPRA
jgi:beta-alanine degradation protein BauB